MGVGLQDRERRVGFPQQCQLGLLGVVGLIPGAEHPRGLRLRLAAGRLGEPAQGVGGLRAGEEAQADRVSDGGRRRVWLVRGRGGHLDAPGPRVIGPEPEIAGLRVVGEHPVTGGREQPRNRVVGRLRAAVAQAPSRREQVDQRILVRLVGTIGDVVLDHHPALVDRVRALAEAEVTLPLPRPEADPDRLDPAVGGDRDVERDHTLRPGPQADRERARRIGGRQGCEKRSLRPARVDHPGGVGPARRGAEPERPGGAGIVRAALAQHRAPAVVGELEVPGARGDLGAQGAGVDLRLGRRRGRRRERRHRREPGRGPTQARAPCTRRSRRGSGPPARTRARRFAASAGRGSSPRAPRPGRARAGR